MRFSIILLLVVACALTAVATAPRTDFVCLAQRALHAADEDHERWSCMHYAAARGDTAAIKRMLAYGADIDQRNAYGRTPLAEAARLGQIEAARLLIARGAELEAFDTKSGFTPLHLAAQNHHPAVVRTLLMAGADPNVHNQWQQTPLWQTAWQAWHGNTQIAHILVAFGAQVDLADEQGHTPLHMAARAGHAPMVAYLIEVGADVDHVSDRGRTPLYQAALGNHVAAARILLAHGADPDVAIDGWTPLRLAVSAGHYKLADLLVRNGASGYEQYVAQARLAAGQRLLESKQFEDAIQNLDQAIALTPQEPQAYFYRGLARIGQGSPDRAQADFNRALALSPHHTGALEWLGVAYARSGEYRQALDALERLIRERPDYGRGYQLLAQSLQALGQPERAQQGLQTACRLGYQPACD